MLSSPRFFPATVGRERGATTEGPPGRPDGPQGHNHGPAREQEITSDVSMR